MLPLHPRTQLPFHDLQRLQRLFDAGHTSTTYQGAAITLGRGGYRVGASTYPLLHLALMAIDKAPSLRAG